jgi:hypothetical protein
VRVNLALRFRLGLGSNLLPWGLIEEGELICHGGLLALRVEG